MKVLIIDMPASCSSICLQLCLRFMLFESELLSVGVPHLEGRICFFSPPVQHMNLPFFVFRKKYMSF
jgi:hypothetical protein